MPELTIGVPVFNGEPYLAQALAGLRSQTFPHFRVVIADNASTDHTPDIAKRVVAEDPRFSYVRRERNIGLVPNFNRLFHETTGEYFAWHAADDVVEPDFYRACVDLLRARPEAVAAMTGVVLMDEDGAVLGPEPEAVRADHPDRAVRFADLASLRHFSQFTYGVYRRAAMARTRLMLPFFWTSDRVFLAELALQGPLVRDPRPLYRVRQHHRRVTLAGRAAFYAGRTPRRGTMLRYSRELGLAIDHAGLDPAERGRLRRRLWMWRLRHGHLLLRSSVGALVGVAAGSVPRRRPAPPTAVRS
ncbi:MAG TPA: glycosyltransferase family 2 protein [Natronosporangium sp.]|nr:glycosyltransferase family 2 protein [Natronosporangium sp.]